MVLRQNGFQISKFQNFKKKNSNKNLLKLISWLLRKKRTSLKMPRMWLTKEENPLKLSTFLLKSNEMSDMHFARKIARLGIAAHPNPIQKNYSEHSSFAIVFANGASSKVYRILPVRWWCSRDTLSLKSLFLTTQEICEKINNVQDGFQATIDVASNCSPSLAKHSQVYFMSINLN